MKQDRNGVRTAQDLERKYNFSSIKKSIEQTELGLTKINSELDNFIISTVDTIDNMQSQIDGNITTYYYSGVPTLSNLPASEWTTNEEKNRHLGDLYYDKNTGYAYRFYYDSENLIYGWTKLTDSDVTEALSLANAAKDTADGKRRVFTSQPIPPYDNGDLWFNNEEIYICQVARQTGSYIENDFIIATKYTDDTYAEGLNDSITVLSGEVTTIKENVSSINVEMEENKYYIDSSGNKVLLRDEINNLEIAVSGINQTITSTGGNNLLKNTGLFFGEENNFDYWIGNLKRTAEENSATKTAMLLQNGIVYQETDIPNGTYTIRFKYKRINPTAICQVNYNGREPINLGAEGIIQTSGEITTGTFKIEFNCDVLDGYEIYELMLNHGSTPAIYSQNMNELRTDTVQIGKGISVSSNSTSTTAKIDADGFRVINNNSGNNVLKATSTGIETPDVKANSGTIANLYFQQVGDQTWITGLGE